MATPIALSTIAQIAIPVKDLARAIAFYRDTLGMKFLFEAPPALAPARGTQKGLPMTPDDTDPWASLHQALAVGRS